MRGLLISVTMLLVVGHKSTVCSLISDVSLALRSVVRFVQFMLLAYSYFVQQQ